VALIDKNYRLYLTVPDRQGAYLKTITHDNTLKIVAPSHGNGSLC